MKHLLAVLGLLTFAPLLACAQQQYIISAISGGGPPFVTPARGLDLQIGAVYFNRPSNEVTVGVQ